MEPHLEHLTTEEALSRNLTVVDAELTYARGGSHLPGLQVTEAAPGHKPQRHNRRWPLLFSMVERVMAAISASSTVFVEGPCV